MSSNSDSKHKGPYRAKMSILHFNTVNKKSDILNSFDVESEGTKNLTSSDLGTSIYDLNDKIMVVYTLNGKINTFITSKDSKAITNKNSYSIYEQKYQNFKYLSQDNIEYDIKNQFYNIENNTLAVAYTNNKDKLKHIALYKVKDDDLEYDSEFVIQSNNKNSFEKSFNNKTENKNKLYPYIYKETSLYNVKDKLVIIDSINMYFNMKDGNKKLFDKKYILIQVYSMNDKKLIYSGELRGSIERDGLFDSYNSNIMPSIKIKK
ncbi:hypothetical protein [Peptostreptococcus equinus]|uniref:Uncharacterized protein n=1 Tax=Peptostreptococcus equinus TaxID=3003601 RepID=A0ABY7JQZ1_9FIRM|nr:hypothetical protein [Peptostreptococcus sp. CBA3647]WAW15776.1 hypothetical protein O0R46_04810 [Peptostreptococcus sp. CBA3647]